MLSTTVIFRRLSTAPPTGRTYRLLPRIIYGSRVARRQSDPPNPVLHDIENYFVDGDDTPPPNVSIYKVDATSDAAESAYESPSGPWSRAGAEVDEYQTVSRNKLYDVPSGRDVKLRYGGMKKYAEDKGPEGTERWGRKPEGRA